MKLPWKTKGILLTAPLTDELDDGGVHAAGAESGDFVRLNECRSLVYFLHHFRHPSI